MSQDKNPLETIVQEVSDDGEIQSLIPAMNVNVPAASDQPENPLVSDETLLGAYNEILVNLRDDREKASDFMEQFAEMVINGGDASSASKEALVNFLKIRSDANDKMAKIAELMTRIKMKDKDTFPRYLAAKQNNTININSGKKQLIQDLSNAQRKARKQARSNSDE